MKFYFLFYQQTKPTDEDELEGGEPLLDIEAREHMLQQLLVLLNSAAAVGLGPEPGDLGKQYSETIQPIRRDYGLKKG